MIWLLLTLLPASPREIASLAMGEWEKSGAALSWESHVLGDMCLEFLKDSLQIAYGETLKLFWYSEFLKSTPWSFTMIQEEIDEMRFRKHE